MKITFETIIVVIFYLILIAIIGISFFKVLDSPTAFEEYEIYNYTKLPSFTICPYPDYSLKSIGTFEEAMMAIDNAKDDYSMKWTLSRPFKEG